MKKQNFQLKDDLVIKQFIEVRKKPDFKERIEGGEKIRLSWSNWGFGLEPLEVSCARLSKFGVRYIELHGNRYGPDLGYKTQEVKKVLDDYGIKVSGVCGMVNADSELSSNKPYVIQRSIDYFRRQIDMCAELGGAYVLFSPAAVGRPQKYDDNEFYRVCDALRILGDYFLQNVVRAAIEPVRSAEVSFCHTFREALELINYVNHPGVQHIGGDLYHMWVEEEHIPTTLIEYGKYLTNLHLADSNRRALGKGFMDIDLVVMALYVIGYNRPDCFVTAEPLGPGADPYPAMWGKHDPKMLDELVRQTATYFYEREQEVLQASDEELLR